MDANRARLARLARAYAGSDWRDLHQEILLQVWRGLDSFQGRSTASTWLYRVALNTALTWRRKSQPPTVSRVSSVDDLPDAIGATGPEDPLRVLNDFLSSLNGIDRAILLLYLEDASYAEITDVTGLSQSNVGVRINRLKRAFVDRYIGE